MDRRDFLRKGAMLGGAAYLGSQLPGAFAAGRQAPLIGTSVTPGTSILDMPATAAPIDTVVVLMMENRSIDHYLGWLATDAAYLANGQSRYGPGFGFVGDNTQTYTDDVDAVPGQASVDTYHLPTNPPQGPEDNPYRGCHHPDPGHGWNAGRAQRDGGFLANGAGNDEFALGYYLADDVPLYASMARRFTTFDSYHCSLLAPTFPNREYLHSAQSGGIKNNSIPFQTLGFQWATIWDKLRDAGMVPGVDAAYFSVDLPAIALWGPRMIPFAEHIEQYFARAAAGTLPKVVFLDPGFTTGLRTDDHPYADIRAGQKLVLDYLKAFRDSPHWQRGAFFVTYDEWGGFFDHVAPLRLPDDRATPADPGGEDDFGQAGFRVPTLMASPYALEGYVDHRVYDHTSILRFLEWRFLGAPAEGPGVDGESWYLTTRDRYANNIGASLRAGVQNGEFDLPLVPEVPVTSLPCEDEEFEGLPLSAPGSPLAGATASGGAAGKTTDYYEQHAFEKALDSGYFEHVGFDINLKPIPSL